MEAPAAVRWQRYAACEIIDAALTEVAVACIFGGTTEAASSTNPGSTPGDSLSNSGTVNGGEIAS